MFFEFRPSKYPLDARARTLESLIINLQLHTNIPEWLKNNLKNAHISTSLSTPLILSLIFSTYLYFQMGFQFISSYGDA